MKATLETIDIEILCQTGQTCIKVALEQALCTCRTWHSVRIVCWHNGVGVEGGICKPSGWRHSPNIGHTLWL